MAKAYSLDLRERILSAWQNQESSQRGLAKRFKVSLAFVSKLLRQYRETGNIKPKKQGGDRRSKLKGENVELLKTIVNDKNDLYLREIQGELLSKTGIKVSTSSLCRQLQKLKLGRKKKVSLPVNKKRKESKNSGMNFAVGWIVLM